MLYKKHKNIVGICLDTGESVMDALATICEETNVNAALITGLGGASNVTLGQFNSETKEYTLTEYCGDLEVIEFSGSVTMDRGQRRIHLHIVLSDEQGRVYGGHMQDAIVGVTAELYITEMDIALDHILQEDTGILKLMFPD